MRSGWSGLALVLLLEGKAMADPVLERRVQRLSEELRCVVCQNQTIADSPAPLAVELKQRLREQLVAGASDAEAVDHLVQRYGDFVRYRPPLKGTTTALWFGPFVMLLGGLAVLAARLRRFTTRRSSRTAPRRR